MLNQNNLKNVHPKVVELYTKMREEGLKAKIKINFLLVENRTIIFSIGNRLKSC